MANSIEVKAPEGVKARVRVQKQSQFAGFDGAGNPILNWVDEVIDEFASETRSYAMGKGTRLIVEERE